MRLSLLALSCLILCSGCSSTVDRFIPREDLQVTYTKYFNKQKIKPLNKEWKELYDYARNGHILKSPNQEGLFTSIEMYNYLNVRRSNIFDISFFQDYNNVLAFFGEPRDVLKAKGKLLVMYRLDPLNDTCESCTIHPFVFVFDAETIDLA